MTGYTYDERIVSDLYKEVYGFRPSQWWWQEWKSGSEDAKQQLWDELCQSHEVEMEHQREQDARAIAEFEAQVAMAIQLGANGREQAIAWIVDALELSETDRMYGGDRVCWELGLPFSMASTFDPYL